MKDFQHPNVMSLIGVCLDAGPGVSIVMPFMANGSLLEYLKKERDKLYLTEIDEIDEVKFAYGVHDAHEFVISI
jgi:serine/threonine protein kinase